jgi:hypothetical protein
MSFIFQTFILLVLLLFIATIIYEKDQILELHKSFLQILVQAHIGFDGPEVKIDENGIFKVKYPGVQRSVYNPLTVTTGALKYYSDYTKNIEKEQSRKNFINSADWLVDNNKDKEDYSLWEYEYPWRFYGWISPPYVSALAQAKGLQVLILAYELTENEKYFNLAKKTIRSFLIDYDKGGFVSYENIGNNSLFLHIIAKPGLPKTYVLNGHTQSLISIWNYYEKTYDPIAKLIFDKGINYLNENLIKYDSGYWSYYDLMENWSMLNYHKGQIQQLKILYQISKEPILKDFADRFEKYLKYSSLE